MNLQLTNVPNISSKNVLTSKRYTSVKFSVKLCGETICKRYKVNDLQKDDKIRFTNLLGQMLEMNWEDVENKYRRPDDKEDKTKEGIQICHYGKNGDSMRIHGYIDSGMLIIVKVDPNHKVHNK